MKSRTENLIVHFPEFGFFRSLLVESDGFGKMFLCNIFTDFGRGNGVAFARRQTDRHAAALAADFLPAAVKNAGRIAGTEGITAVETAFVAEVEQAEQRGRNVYLADGCPDSLRPDEFRAVNQQGNPIGFRRNFGCAVFLTARSETKTKTVLSNHGLLRASSINLPRA